MNLDQLIEYDKWANQRVFEKLSKLPQNEIRDEICRLFSHLLSAQLVWFNRVSLTGGTVEIWPELSLEEMEGLLVENPAKLKTLIPQADKVITYSNSYGKQFKNSIEEILLHITIHGQHHRAQIATLFRKAGTAPPPTDFIFFARS
ncbi:MAG: DinB family protein [Balneolaceae bacterium]